jgi:hypothetical protein
VLGLERVGRLQHGCDLLGLKERPARSLGLDEALGHPDRLDDRRLDLVELLQDAQDHLPKLSRESRAYERAIMGLRTAGLHHSQLEQPVDARARGRTLATCVS